MIALLTLLGVGVWVAIGLLIGKWVNMMWSLRWLQVAVVVLWVVWPLWDVIPAKAQFDDLARREAGVHVYRTVSGVEGYWASGDTDCDNCGWRGGEGDFPYRYFEKQRTKNRALLDPIAGTRYAGPDDEVGFFQYRIGTPGSTECKERSLPGLPESHSSVSRRTGGCVYVTRTDKPISEYAYQRTNGFDLKGTKWVPIRASTARAFRLENGQTLAFSATFIYVPWVCRNLIPTLCKTWQAPEHGPFSFDLETVLIPRMR